MIRRYALGAPWAACMILTMWALHFGAPHGALALRASRGVGQWQLLSAGLTTGSVRGLLLASAAVAALIVPAERILGTARAIAVAAAAHLASVALGMGVARVLAAQGFHRWGGDLLHASLLSPVSWLCGTAAFASTAMPLLWRRRIGVWLVALCATLVLFSGSLADVVAASSTALGLAAGAVAHGRTRRHLGSVREVRVLVGTLLAAVACGPVVASANPGSASPLAAVGSLAWLPARAGYEAALACRGSHGILGGLGGHACREAVAAAQQAGVGPSLANLVPLAVQAVIVAGLFKGRRLAWWLALVSQAAAICTLGAQMWVLHREAPHAASPMNLAAVCLPWLCGLAVLLATRRHFRVSVSARRARRFGVAMAGALAGTSALWLAASALLRLPLSAQWALLPLRYLPPALAPFFPPGLAVGRPAAWLLHEWVGAAFGFFAAIALYRLLMSVPDEGNARDRERARGLLTHGDHLQAMTLWEGNRYWFGRREGREGREGYVAYRVHRGVAVTVGEPVGGPGLAAGFEAFAASRGWTVAWYSVGADFAHALPDHQRIHVAEEAVLPTERAEFRGKRFQNVRTARNRAAKEGIEAYWTTWEEAGMGLRQRIAELSEEWLAGKELPEMGFTLGTLAELSAPGTRLLVAEDAEGRLHAVTSWLPVYERGELVGLTLDFLRRDAAGFKSAVELLISQALIDAAGQGLGWISLSGAPLARTTPAEGLVDQALDRVGSSMEPFYGFRSLAASKHKFHPEYHPWYVLCRDELALPSVALAVSQCYLPQLRAAQAARLLRMWLSAALVRGGQGGSS
ncbi:bifunctional lysylphosphatidylglycerol flippase/synthetase MprF [Corynebacterium mastitidis]